MQRTPVALPDLYADDETAWLDAMVELLDAADLAALDYDNLREYLADMAKRDRREVESRLVVVLLHVLKWVHQPAHRTASRRATLVEQRQELESLMDRGVLRIHAETVLPEVYRKAVERAVAETGLPTETFPSDSGFTLAEWMAFRANPAESSRITPGF
ncbi:MAG: DUF29 domain-containing protein [Fimbriiglobus sp.]